MPGYWKCEVGGAPLSTFISPLDLSNGLISCEWVEGPDWTTRFGPWASRGALNYAKWLLRLAAP